MKLENQVVSLELAEQLKELGVKQESLFNYSFGIVDDISLDYGFKKSSDALLTLEYLSAFTVAELGIILAHYLDKNIWFKEIREEMIKATYMIDEADARAKMLIYLIENNLYDTRTI